MMGAATMPTASKDDIHIYRTMLPPFMGFCDEQYIPQHHSKSSGWASFYTCVCNGKRVYVWAYGASSRDNTCCVMVSDNYDPAYGAGVAELQHIFADQHSRQRDQRKGRTHHIPAEPLVLQAFINEVTRGGNENIEIVIP
jgi:hypothetical protein